MTLELLITMLPLQMPLKQLTMELPVKIIQSFLKYQKVASNVKDKLMEDTMPIPKLTAKHSTSAQLMDKEAFPSTHSFAPTELSSTKTTSSAIGGLTSIVPLLRNFTPLTKILLPSVKLIVQKVQLMLH